ncbi:dihydroxyacetone kinase subunit L [Starkeya sp. ORNL1]|uniref:dihydroxyacetone kinase subunit L n=1 Tax=Starkeya sp. ORNL1 TaxID=2709380 RepID=UPI001463A3BE|nr:dihydroxyacetone kinase subunit L [Starkeya sp. ORNL1]QJP15043.1 dihydroxyacetone kinase subunit L [Starkeya sp. ORNL1]
MGLSVADLRRACADIAARMPSLEPMLNEADSRLGDGDTGIMLRRVFEKVAEAASGAPDDVAGFFRAIGRASAGATGSSLGTLLTTAFLTIAKAGEGRSEIAWNDLGAQLGAARDAMMARGRASLGDKTVLDALDAVAQAIAGLDDPEAIKRAALGAAQGALDTFRDRPCKIGRARMFAEKSIGMDDPGMLAFVRLVETLCATR